MDGLLLTVHIFAAAVWIGAGIYFSVAYPRYAAAGVIRKVVAVDQKLGSIVFGMAIGLVLLSGIGLVLMADNFNFSHAFVIVGIGAIVVSSILEGAVFAPQTRKALEGEGPVVFPPVFRWVLPIYVVLFGFTVWAMVTKLGA